MFTFVKYTHDVSAPTCLSVAMEQHYVGWQWISIAVHTSTASCACFCFYMRKEYTARQMWRIFYFREDSRLIFYQVSDFSRKAWIYLNSRKGAKLQSLILIIFLLDYAMACKKLKQNQFIIFLRRAVGRFLWSGCWHTFVPHGIYSLWVPGRRQRCS